ncbi:MAG: phosphopyruvate hydratase [Desulfurococcales archaeon]|nr:phosphopyruvate hydratase [Desulfurococcales archaeon]
MEFDIELVKALQVLDSRGNPTVEVLVITEAGGFGRAIAPAGASRGKEEAVDLRDGGSDYGGMGVRKAVESVNKYIAPAITGMSTYHYRAIDRKMIEVDGTPNKSKLGGNATTATSLAVIKAASDTAGIPLFEFLGGRRARYLPVPMMNVLNGGVHAGNGLSIQEFMIVPYGADTFTEALKMAVEVYKALKNYLKETYGPASINVGDEGGFAPPLSKTQDALTALEKAIELSGYDVEGEIGIALDAAATQFYDDSRKKYFIDGEWLTPEELLEHYEELLNAHRIVSFEDPFGEAHPEMFGALKDKAHETLIIGDDITVTKASLIEKHFLQGYIDGAIIKVNQIGTFTEAEEAIDLLMMRGGKAIISHRSGETEDTTIAHIAVGCSAPFIKGGAPARGERTAKYNELLRIEDYLGGDAIYVGEKAFSR